MLRTKVDITHRRCFLFGLTSSIHCYAMIIGILSAKNTERPSVNLADCFNSNFGLTNAVLPISDSLDHL